VRAASKHRGSWPTISVWHGTSDPIVKFSNGEDIIRQWTDVQELSKAPSHEELAENYTRRVWRDANGDARIEAFSIDGMAHGVPLATRAEDSCGSAGAFFLDVGISSTHRIARFWRLHESVLEMPRAEALVPQNSRPLVLSDAAAKGADNSAEPLYAHWQQRPSSYSLNPNAVITAAFKAAGLPVPEFQPVPRSPHQVEPGPIIAAALKAAGLRPR
jgi:hypothetical protein